MDFWIFDCFLDLARDRNVPVDPGIPKPLA